MNRPRFLPRFLLAALGLLTGCSAPPAAARPQNAPPMSLKPVNPRCEQDINPLGVDAPRPHLGWQLQAQGAAARGLRQAAYRVLVASSPATLDRNQGDLWDSGRVASDRTLRIPYGGKDLRSAQQAFWKVRAWDQDGNMSGWSPPARWTMGVLRDADWQGAKWVGATAVAGASGDGLIGYHAAETQQQDDVKWVQVDLGRPVPISGVHLYPMQHAGREGFGFPLRFTVETADDADFTHPAVIADRTAADYPNPGVAPVSFDAHGVSARFVRVTATKLWLRDAAITGRAAYAFALRRLEVDSGGRDVAAGATVTAKDSVESSEWGRTALTAFASLPSKAAQTDSLLLRRRFTVGPHLARALAFVCGLGQYEMSVNGRKAGADVLAPGWSKYDKTCLYDTRDVTPLLRPGENAVGLLLGNGMYNVHGGRYTKFTGSFGPQKAVCLIRLEYADGSAQTVKTDDAWRMAPGPITFSSVYGGEDYDARLLPSGWDRPGFDDGRWDKALAVPGPGGALRGQGSAAPPIVPFETFPPIAVKQLRPGVAVYDLGQNAAFMPRLTVSGPAGATVQITPAELANADGSVDRSSVGGGEAFWKYTLAGGGPETYVPKFFYHGCRFLQVALGAPAGGGELPSVTSLEGVVVGSASAPTGRFACSNALFNRINTLIRWAQRSNMVSVLTDCPHRERLGWLEEDHLNGPSLRYDFDLNALFGKIENDMADSQTGDGLVPSIAPEYPVFGGDFRDSPEWGSAFLLVPWQQYQFTADTALLARHYDAMKRYVAHLAGRSQGDIVSYGLGDWYDIGPKEPGYSQLTPIALTATAFYYQDAVILARAAALLGRGDDQTQYEALAARIKAAFNRKFWNADARQYATGSQCANSIPLVMGLVAPADRPAVLDNVVKDVQAKGLTAGDVGYRYLLQALAQGGRSDVIYAMNNQSDRPGYGYQLKQGATSLTEAWDARRSSSQNHFMLGQIMEWFYGDLAGIQPDPAGPGFQKIIIRPAIVGDLTEAHADYDSVRGRISSAWRRGGGRVTLDVTIPPNATATVYVPTRAPGAVTEGGRAADRSPGVTFLKAEDGAALYAVGSGRYSFSAPFAE